MANEKQEKEKKKRRPYTPPTITVVTYNPRDKVMTWIGCENGSGSDEIGNCETLSCELP